ncbi:MAG TPA: NAD(P)/FAD-dependent oxidoreductase [Candidatus Limnocylindrales bacterium]|nr:NAD(P)/FAD-dependent oxidoreductase [Candidatus Limnocylindrales bacterium]
MANKAGDLSDVAVVGTGFAGLSTAIGLRRHRLSTIAFDGGPVRNEQASEVHGYLGAAGLPAKELRDRGRTQAIELGAQIVEAQIEQVERTGEVFMLRDVQGRTYGARRLVLATGVVDQLPEIAGLGSFFGRSVHVCPHCDAYEWRDRPIAIIGDTAELRDFAIKLSHWSARVTVVGDNRPTRVEESDRTILAVHGIGVIETGIDRLEGEDGQLSAIRFLDGEVLAVDAAFCHADQTYRTELAEALGCKLTEAGAIEVDDEGHASAEGVWAVGDVAGDSQFVSVAVAHGIKAAADIYRTLAETDPDTKEP